MGQVRKHVGSREGGEVHKNKFGVLGEINNGTTYHGTLFKAYFQVNELGHLGFAVRVSFASDSNLFY